MKRTIALVSLVGGILLAGCSTDVEVVSGQVTPPTTTLCIRPEGVGDCLLNADPLQYTTDQSVEDTSADALSSGPSGAVMTDEQIAAFDAKPLFNEDQQTTTTIAVTTTTAAPVVLYRARNGDAGRGELVARMYLERKVSLSSALLGFSDYDPDGDGWALVARTNGDGDNGPVAKFWLVGGVPRVSTRHPQKGCLELTPQSLAEVRKGQTRFMTEVAQNTANCRVQPPDADTDNNGIADNVQPLFRARNGDTGRGELVGRVYFERNLAASEATIGVSDYDPDADGWALVGRSNGASDDGIVGQMTMNGSAPFVTVTKSNGTCLKLTPTSLSLVARGQTRFLSSSAC